MPERGFFYDLSPACRPEKCLREQSPRHHVAYVCTHLFYVSNSKHFDEKRKYKTPYRHNHTDSQEMVLTHVRTIRPGGRQNAGDAATQLLCITAVCTYRLRSDDGYVHKQQTRRMPRVNTSINSIYVLVV